MALGGLHRDSILNLAALVSENEYEKEAEKQSVENKETAVEDENCIVADPIFENEKAIADSNFVPINNDPETQITTDSMNEIDKLTSDSNAVPPMNDPASHYYSSFQQNYDDYDDYRSFDPYAPSNFYFGEKPKRKNLFGCLFPFCIPKSEVEEEYDEITNPTANDDVKSESNNIETIKTDVTPEAETIIEKSEDNSKDMNSELLEAASSLLKNDENKQKKMDENDNEQEKNEKFGTPLTSSERLAVLARLRLQGYDDDDEPEEEKKENVPVKISKDNFENSKNSKYPETIKKPIANITIEEKSQCHEKENEIKSILKKQSALPSFVSDEEDAASRRSLFKGVAYETKFTKEKTEKNNSRNLRFSPMAKVVVVPGRQHFSQLVKADIWWSRNDYDEFKKTGRIISRAMLEGGSEIWLSSKSGLKMSDMTNESKTADEKWWCKFGHSRRGLEHIVSLDEGRHRQENVSLSIKTIINEQRRQRLYNCKDEIKLSTCASKYTSFARDLALAAGKADAEAVRSNFRGKQRPHYTALPRLKAFNEENLKSLDAYTNTTSYENRLERRKLEFENESKTPSSEISSSNSMVSTPPSNTNVYVHVHKATHNHSNITKKAAGFGTGENDDVGFVARKTPSFDNQNATTHQNLIATKAIDRAYNRMPVGTVSN